MIVAGYYGIMLAVHVSVHQYFHFWRITSKPQWIFTKLCVCIDVVEIWFATVNGQISSIFDWVICPRHVHYSKYQWIITKLGVCIDIVETCLSYVYPYFCFRTITWVNLNRFSPNSVSALMLWRSGLWLLMGRFCQFFIKLSAGHTSIFSFPDDNFSKYQWIFTELGMCIDIEETWYGIADGQISSIFDSYLPATCPYFHFWTITLVNINGFSSNLVRALILWRSAFGLLMGKFHPFLTELSVHNTSVFYFQDNNE